MLVPVLSTRCVMLVLVLYTRRIMLILVLSTRCILATDMSKHSEILSTYTSLLPSFDFSNKDHKAVVSTNCSSTM